MGLLPYYSYRTLHSAGLEYIILSIPSRADDFRQVFSSGSSILDEA